MENDDLKNKTDDELLYDKLSKYPFMPESIEASKELHRRQRILENKNMSLQRHILLATIIGVIIAAITLFVVLRPSYRQGPSSPNGINKQNDNGKHSSTPSNGIKGTTSTKPAINVVPHK